MAWLFGQVWLLCLIAFLLGAVVTWIAFVVPARRASRRRPTMGAGWTPTPPTGLHPQPQPPRPVPAAEPRPSTPPPGVPLGSLNSALAALDAWNGPAGTRPGTAEEATSALERLGVGAQPQEPTEPTGPPPPVEPPEPGPSLRKDGPPAVPTQHGSPED